MKRALVLLAVLAAAPATARGDGGWELRVPDRVELVAGASGTLPITIAVDRDRAISKDAGIVLDLAPEGGVTVPRRRLGRSDAVDPDASSPRFAVPLRAQAAGDYRVKLHVRFWICGQRVCRPADARRTVAVAVAAPASPPGPPAVPPIAPAPGP